MKANNREDVYSAIIFSVMGIAYLLFHFSWWGCIPAALAVGAYFICVPIAAKRDEKKAASERIESRTITYNIGTFSGIFLVEMLLIGLCAYGIEKVTFPSTGAFIGAVIILVGEIAALLFFCWGGELYLLGFGILFGATVGCSYIFIEWKNASVLLALLFVEAIGLVLKRFMRTNNSVPSHVGFAFLAIAFILFNVTNMLYPEFSIAVVDRVMRLFTVVDLPWYKAVIFIVLALVGVVETMLLRNTRASESTDTQIYILLLMSGIFAWVLSSFKTQYNVIIIALFLIANAVFLCFHVYDWNRELFGFCASSSNIIYALTLAVLTGFPVAFYYGSILQYFVLAVAMLFVILVCGKGAPDTDGGVRPCFRWLFWQAVLTLAAIYAAVVVTLKCRTFSGYVLILAVYALATLALFILNLQNRAQHKNHYLLRIFIVIPAVLILLFAVDQSMVKVSYRVDNAVSSSEELDPDSVGETGDLIVTVSSKEKDAHFAKVYGYWAGDKETVIELTPAEENRLPLRSDCLCVVCEDESGLIHTDRHWFFPEADAVQEFVGWMRPQRFPALFSVNKEAAE